jgi:hypothetical protein
VAFGLVCGCVEVDPDYVPIDGTGLDDTGTTGGPVSGSMTATPVDPTTGSQDDSSGAPDTTSGGSAESGSGDGSSGGSGESSTGADCSEEICDGFDNDCDEAVDEDCECVVGSEQPCYSADPVTLDVGPCVAGTQICAADGWGACEGEVGPTAETCNGVDDDCNTSVDDGFGQQACGEGICQVEMPTCDDGVPVECVPGPPDPSESCNGIDDTCEGDVDEGCTCLDGQTQDCYSGPGGTVEVGVCDFGTQTCIDGAWGDCEGDVLPTPETCDGEDDNCNGTADDGNPGGGTPCQTGLPGLCGPSQRECIDGALACPQTVFPVAEVCDGFDNDCDTGTDEGNPGGGQACNTGLQGVCADGTTDCSGGMIECDQTVMSSAEQCDGLDNDCDGSNDEGNPGSGQMCMTGLQGVCAAGLTNCSGGSLGCVQQVMPSSETCDNADNDCDGSVDEGNPGGGAACNTGLLGQCAAGIRNCVGGALVCQQSVMASAETCDNVDNDCDGSTDEGNPGGGAACNTGQAGQCAAGVLTCSGGALVCQQSMMASAEVCDNVDNDCDGATDEGNPGGGGGCMTGQQGVCGAGTLTCQSGALNCVQNVSASAETCDGLDNDCDGSSDEGNPGGGVACSTGLAGVCATGTRTCMGGSLQCIQNVMAGAEVCGDGLDNDCDGTVDDGCGGCSERVTDGGFEAGTPSVAWTEASLIFGTPLCTAAVCGLGGGSGQHGGTWWSWFGGYDGHELASVSQTITIPAGSTATLRFWLEIPVCASQITDSLVVTIDGVEQIAFDNGDPVCDVIGYAQHSIDVSAFADGGNHTLEFVGEVFGNGPPAQSITNFMVDDVSVQACD